MTLKKDYWKNLADHDALLISCDLSIIARRRRIVSALFHKGGRLLDLGCGPEFFLFDKVDKFWRVGLDLSFNSFKKIIKNPLLPNANGCFVNADALRLPFAANSFDVVISSNSFDHFLHPEQALNEVNRVLRDSGEFVLCVPLRLPGGLKAHEHIFTIYDRNKIEAISGKHFVLAQAKHILVFYSLFWNGLVSLFNLAYSLWHKLTLRRGKRKHLYVSNLYILFSAIFSGLLDGVDKLFSILTFPSFRQGYLLVRLVKK